MIVRVSLCFFIVNEVEVNKKIIRYYALTDYLHVFKLIGSDCTAFEIFRIAFLCSVSFSCVRVEV